MFHTDALRLALTVYLVSVILEINRFYPACSHLRKYSSSPISLIATLNPYVLVEKILKQQVIFLIAKAHFNEESLHVQD